MTVYPKLVEQQKVFCDQTVTAVKTHSLSNEEDTAETVNFIGKV